MSAFKTPVHTRTAPSDRNIITPFNDDDNSKNAQNDRKPAATLRASNKSSKTTKVSRNHQHFPSDEDCDGSESATDEVLDKYAAREGIVDCIRKIGEASLQQKEGTNDYFFQHKAPLFKKLAELCDDVEHPVETTGNLDVTERELHKANTEMSSMILGIVEVSKNKVKDDAKTLASADLLKTASLGNDELYNLLQEKTTKSYCDMAHTADARQHENIKQKLKPITEAWKTKLEGELKSIQLTGDSLNWEAMLKLVSIQALDELNRSYPR